MKKTLLLATTLLSLGLITTGCASTAKGLKTSQLAESVPTESLRPDMPDDSVLVVVRYPAAVDSAAKDVFHRAYARRAIGGQTGLGVTNTIETVAIADASIVKSNYFALSLYKELAARLPEHSVLLSPHMIKLGTGGELTSEPMTAAENLPSVLAVDFATYSFPDSKKMMGDVPLTFGDLITPLVTVRTDHRAAAPVQGVLMASRPLVSRAAAEGRETAIETLKAMQEGELTAIVPELDFISYITDDTPQNVAVEGLKIRSQKNATLSLPVEKLQIPATEMASLKGASDGTVDPLDDIYTEPLAQRILALMNGVDPDKALMMGKAASVAEFDPSLAALTFVGSNDTDYVARLNYAERLLEAQRKYLSVQSLRIFDGIHNGELGAQVRDMIAAEHGIMEQRRALARQQNMMTALAIAGAVAGGAAIAKSDGDGNNYGNRILADIAIQSAIYAGIEAYSTAERSQLVGNNYLNSIVPALEQQTTVTVDLLDANETITAVRYEDLQAKLQSLYTARQRSLDTVATRCAYLDNLGNRTGTWLGVCDGGLANGEGAGVLETDTEIMEYFGYAQNGLAEGPGLMIRHTDVGSIAFEGSFASGQPDGAVRVSQSGRPDVVRNYERGVDRGASDQIPASPFDGPTGGRVN